MISKKMKSTIIKLCILGVITIAFLGLAFINNYVVNKYKQSLSVKGLLKEPTEAVYSEVSSKKDTNIQVIIPPYVGDEIIESASFYNKNDNEEKQKRSIIHYEDTYLPSTGILYTSSIKFDAIAVCDGTVTDVSKDNILGKFVTVKHNDLLYTNYYSLDDVNVKVGDEVTQGQILGSSSKSKISNNEYSLLFEVTYNNEIINPAKIYNQKTTSFS